ncbi:unnamed protein product [Caenorhabditis auriculariae]|uniref:Uncharacterized protein n=1 Tax=Caenorhabditis auriculariae TaxID=2777116 RepID=A0A8S1HH48_9PELO|nr:unnamed protein product [Caenorhabditis auriculariae]
MQEGVVPGHARLEKVFGRNSVGVNSFAINAQTNSLLYISGSSVVVSSTTPNSSPEGHLISSDKQAFTCVAVSSCGRFAATGEAGHKPAVRIWEIRSETGAFTGKFLRALTAHQVSVTIVKFTPNDSTLISVGCQHDAGIIAWDWRSGKELQTGRLMSPVNALAISFDGSMCVTVGTKTIKYWFIPQGDDAKSSRGFASRSAILADKRNATFVDVAFCDASNRMMAVTANGNIIELNENKKYVKGYSWRTPEVSFRANCIARIPEGLLIGCDDGMVRLFSLTGDDLDFVADLSSPVALGIDPSKVYSAEKLRAIPDGAIYPEVRCIVASPNSPTFAVGYADRTMVEFSRENRGWQFRRACMAHVGPINSVEMYPPNCPYLPSETFITGGSDGTVRFWSTKSSAADRQDWVNFLFPPLLKVLYLEEEISALVEKRNTEVVGAEKAVAAEDELLLGICCTRVTLDGRILVAGTRTGVLHLIDLSFPDMPTLDVIQAHDSEVTCAEFSDRVPGSDAFPQLLATGGRDQFVHIFRRAPFTSKFQHCAVLDRGQCGVRRLRFSVLDGFLHLFVLTNDKTVIVWRLEDPSKEELEFRRVNQFVSPMSVHDIEVVLNASWTSSSTNQAVLMMAGQDRVLRVMDLKGKLLPAIKGTGPEPTEADKVTAKITNFAVDSSGTYVASVSSDRRVYIVDLSTGALAAVLCGFGTIPMGVTFSHDSKRIIVTTAGGCTFVWKLSKNMTSRMIAAMQKASIAERYLRTPTPDSLFGSGSESQSLQSSHLGLPGLGVPDFGSRSSVISAGGIDGDDEGTGSLVGSSAGRASRRGTFTIERPPTIGLPSTSRVGDSSFSPTVQPAPAVERRSTSNLFANDRHDSDLAETQSDFVSSRRIPEREEETEGRLLLAPNDDGQRELYPYQASKSMMNLRDAGGVRVQTAKELMMSHISGSPSRNNSGSVFTTNGGSPGRRKWGDLAPAPQPTDWQRQNVHRSDFQEYVPRMNAVSPIPTDASNATFTVQGSPYDSPMAPPVGPRSSSRVFTSTPTSRSLIDGPSHQSRTVWSPQTLASSATPRRSNSNLYAAANASPSGLYHSPSTGNANISRRPDDLPYTPFSHLRSRSQSPNKLALSQLLQNRGEGGRESVDSNPSSVGANGAHSRELTRHLQQKRRDSDVSYTTRSTSRGPMSRDGEMRKSTDALNKLMAVRNKLHQSSENLRKSSDNLALAPGEDVTSSVGMRTRSISNLRTANALESFGTFDVDVRSRSGSTSSLAHSRMLARSMGNVSAGLEGSGLPRDFDSPSKRLANTIQLMKKASNPDLTQPDQYDDAASPFAMRMRGAVQKKVDRYRPRNRGGPAGRNQTSEESDSNTSDASPLNQSINKNAAYSLNRVSDWSPTSSLSSKNTSIGGLSSSRRLYEQQRISNVSSPRRGSNYLVQKMSDTSRTMEGPDLGSDDSPRSSVNSHDWQHLIEQGPDGTRNPLVRHVQDCMEQLRVSIDKSVQARKLVEEDPSLSIEQKKVITCEIDRSTERAIEKLSPYLQSKLDDRSNGNVGGNEYAPLKGPQIYGVLKQNLTSRQ